MKRDMELVRTILLSVSNHNKSTLWEIRLDEYSQKDVDYQVDLLVQKGYLTGTNMGRALGSQQPAWKDLGLTWDGHEFIDNAQNEKVWAKFKQVVAEKGGSLSFAVATSLLTSIAKQTFGLP